MSRGDTEKETLENIHQTTINRLGFAEGAQEKDREREHYFEIEATIREF